MPTTISPNMNLPVPVVGVDPGPDWATNVNSCLSIIDSHNHTAGQGVAITPSALNINADLSFQSNNATNLRTTRFTAQSAPLSAAADLGCLYVSGVDLYYNDENGNQIRLTQSGAPAGATGTITGLPSGTASASFAGTTFTFQSATNTPATISAGPYKFGQAVASGFGVTVSASGSQAANYAMTLPVSLPASQKIMSLDNSGNIAANYVVDNSTIEISSNTIQVKDGGITYPKLAALNSAQSSSSGVQTSTSSSFIDVTNQSVTITTSGRPVSINFSGTQIGSGSTGLVEFKVLRGATTLVTNTFGGDSGGVLYPPGCLNIIDFFPPAGSNTYKLQMRSVNGVTGVTVNALVTSVYEL